MNSIWLAREQCGLCPVKLSYVLLTLCLLLYPILINIKIKLTRKFVSVGRQ